MEGVNRREWSNAQEIAFSVDLFSASKQQLRFLAAVDNAGCLYDGPALERAIYRYKNCWLPLLAKHMNAFILEGPLVVPLDCEWIWHCHRLNPLQYKRDCEEIYGKILGTSNVISTVEGSCSKQSELVWNNIYVAEPYTLESVNANLLNDDQKANAKDGKVITYDLVAAVKRQSSFFTKVSKDIKCVDVDRYLEAAVARYKGFIYMTKKIMESNPEINCVPTRDIDLIWHTHQLNSLAYCKNLKATVGVILDHNDRDIGTSEGKKMADQWFQQTEHLWEKLFGNKYKVAARHCFVIGAHNAFKKDNAPACFCSGTCSYNCVGIDAGNALKEDNAPGCSCSGSCSYNCAAIVASNASKEDNTPGCSCSGSCSYNCAAIVTSNASNEDNTPGCSCSGSCSYNCVAIVASNVPGSQISIVATAS